MDMNLSTIMSQSALAEQVGTSLLAKSLNDMKSQGQDMVSLLQSAAPAPIKDPQLGSRIDLFA